MKIFAHSNNKGFSGKELLLTLLVIAALCAASVPVFNALQDQRREARVRNVIRVVQNAIERKKIVTTDAAPQTVYPQALDTQPSQSPCITCFNAVSKRGISNPLWFKVSDTEYAFSRNGNTGDAVGLYTEKGDLRVVYESATGKLSVSRIE